LSRRLFNRERGGQRRESGAEGVTIVLAARLSWAVCSAWSGQAPFRPALGWTVFPGLVSVALGVNLLATRRTAGTYFIGGAIGVDLIFDGASLVGFAGAIHSLPAVQTREA
jgi:uncharacterized membrane protein HdeD (DUF308 family)